MKPDTIEVLDPTSPIPGELQALTPGIGDLSGRVLGIRLDHTWKSFTVFAEAVGVLARAEWKVKDVVFFDPGVRAGTTEEERHKVAGFVRAVDAAVVGLGT